MDGARVLYLSYDGMTDPLGQSQVLPYLAGLARLGHRITLVSFEKPAREAVRPAIAALCADAGIDWRPLPYHARPKLLSTWIDLRAAATLARTLDRAERFDIVHLRSYPLGPLALRLKRRGMALIFDMRGLWIDERIDRGSWPQSNPVYRLAAALARRVERRLLRAADAVVSLTRAGLAELDRRGQSAPAGQQRAVIACAADLAMFRPLTRAKRAVVRGGLGIAVDAPLLLYLGSIGGGYHLAEMAAFFRAWRALVPDAHWLVVTTASREAVIAEAGASDLAGAMTVTAAARDAVAGLVGSADLGVSFFRVGNSAVASSPVKIGEMLACGVPVVANIGVGDSADLLGPETAVLVDGLDAARLAAAAAAAEALRSDPAARTAARALAERHLDLADGIARYDALYRSLARR